MRSVAGILVSLLLASAAVAEEPAPGAPAMGAAASAAPALSQAEREAQAVALKRISERLICQCGCNMILSECSHQTCPFALPERRSILEAIAEGKSDKEIVDAYVARYGRSVLSEPPTEGTLLDRAAWVAPYAALVVGLALLVFFVRRFTSRSATLTAPVGPAGTGPASGDPWLQRVEDEIRQGKDSR